ncbi:MAG: cyclase family protein [Solirubrobacterales bacterium]
MSELLQRATEWTRQHPHARHLDRTLHWVVELEPEASEGLRIAALTHDMERAFPDPEATWVSSRDWSSPAYNEWHQERCARIVAAWLREQGADAELVAEVEALVRVHEDGGWREADLLQAADSLSFLETMVPLVLEWSARGEGEAARGKLEHSVARIQPDQAAAIAAAEGLLERALSELDAASWPSPAAAAAAPEPRQVLRATGLVREGRMFRLAAQRFPGMPLFPGHPPFQVLSYRTPQGLRAAGEQPWGPLNEVGLGYMSEMVIGSQHTGAHIDAHAHMTVGEEDRWHGGSARTELGDFGPLRGDASEIPPLWRRGVLYDLAGFRGVEALPAGEPVGAGELEAIEARDGIAAGEGDVALFRTGYLSRWPDAAGLAAHRGAGPDVGAARLLAERGVIAVGSDTETFEVQPAPDPGEPANPQPVHVLLLIERGIYIMESLYLEDLAAAGVREFLFVALPLAIAGATGSMVDPVAVL